VFHPQILSNSRFFQAEYVVMMLASGKYLDVGNYDLCQTMKTTQFCEVALSTADCFPESAGGDSDWACVQVLGTSA
jgi:hypothetical protein